MCKRFPFPLSSLNTAMSVYALILNTVVLTFACAQEAVPQSDKPKHGRPDAEVAALTGTVVDKGGMPVSAATVRIQNDFVDIDVAITTDSEGQFAASVRVDEKRLDQLQIMATAENGTLMGLHRGDLNAEAGKTIKFELGPAIAAKVKVVDADARPIQAANVAMQLAYPYTLGPSQTDADGIAEVKVPASEKIVGVVAWKDHEGLDFKLYTLPRSQDKDRLTEPPKFPIDAGESLVLAGASPLTVRIVDTKDKPIPEMGAYVWLLQKEDEANQLNMSFFSTMFNEVANEEGELAFNWFPSWQKMTTTVWPLGTTKSTRGFVHKRAEYEPAAGTAPLKMMLERLVPIRGTVTFPDGKPAPGISVGASGAGYTRDGFYGSVKTDDAGQYEILATPNQIYMLYISDKKWSAPAQSGFAILPDREVVRHDFVLRPATRVFGRALDMAMLEPLGRQTVFFTQEGTELDAIGKDVLPNPEKSTKIVCPVWAQTTLTGDDGKYEFYAGPGEYNLFVQGKESIKFTITDENERQVDLPIEVDPVKLLTGLTVDSRSKEPVGDAKIEVVSLVSARRNVWKANSTSDGKFQLKVRKEASYVHAISPDAKLGTIAKVDADRITMILSLVELGSARGKLLTQDGSQASAGTKLLYGVTIEAPNRRFSSPSFGKVIITDENGEFTLTQLVPGWKYECTLFDNPRGYILNVANVTVQPGETKMIGELKTPEEPKPYVPPTLEDRARNAFNVAGTPQERFEKARALVKQVNQSLLVVLAKPEDERAKALMQLRFESPEFQPYADDFLFLAISTSADKFDAAESLAKSMDVSLTRDDGFMLVVVDHDGKVVSKLTSAQVCEDDLLSQDRLLAELDKYKTVPLDAAELLQQAYERADREGKHIFLQETATWCGPCHLLTHLLLENRQWEKDYIWVKMDHRWIGAMEIMEELRGKAEGGIPWMVILDSQGNKLATSNLPVSGANIGFPSEPEGQVHFANMLKATRQRMTDRDIEDLISAATEQ